MRPGGGFRGRALRRRVTAAWALLGLTSVILVGCTDEPTPTPTPTPTADETTEPAPSGVEVGVVLPPAGDPAAGAFLEPEQELADLEADRAGEVASIRAVVPDEPGFVPDVAALLADDGADLVCVLGSDGARTVLDLAERFPATRFCALAAPRDGQPQNVDLFEVAHEELGHVLGVAAEAAAGTAPVGIVLGDDGDERARRRAGARAALADAAVAVDGIIHDATEAAEMAAATEDVELGAVIVDVSDAGVATVVAGAAPGWVGPRGVAVDESAGAAVVRWSIRADVIVGAAVDRLVSSDVPDDLDPLGFEQDLFALTFADDVTPEVRAATELTAEDIGRGTRDPLDAETPVAPGDPDGGDAPAPDPAPVPVPDPAPDPEPEPAG